MRHSVYHRLPAPLETIQEQLDTFFPHSVLILNSVNQPIGANRIFFDSTKLQMEELEEVSWQVLDGPYQGIVEDLGLEAPGKASPVIALFGPKGQIYSSRYMEMEVGQTGLVQEYRLLHLFDLRISQPLSLLQQFAGTLMQDIHLGVILFDHVFRLVEISDTACRLLGLSRHAVLNQTMDLLFQSVPEEYRLVERSVFNGISIRNHPLTWMNKQDRLELLLDTSLLKDDQGQVVGGYITLKDVTNLRSLEEQVQRNDRLAMIGQIAAGTAHEIRNPLTSIKGFIQVFRNTFIENGMAKERNYADIMLTEIDRINELVSEFLLLGKRKDVAYTQVDAVAALNEILPIIHNEGLLYGVAVQVEPLPELPAVVADRELLKQVLLNICKNGIEAMGEGGNLILSVGQDIDAGQLLFHIQDTGPGIPEYLLGKIFDPFFTTKKTGTGLGLSVCQRIIHDIGGQILVSSGDAGTVFTISIPIP